MYKRQEETQKIAKKFAETLQPGDVIALIGELGSGKTTFVVGLTCGLGVKSRVKSPSFVIVNEYTNDKKVYHIDLYRLNLNEVNGIGLDEFFSPHTICVIEWADKIKEILPPHTIFIEFIIIDETTRKIIIKNDFRD